MNMSCINNCILRSYLSMLYNTAHDPIINSVNTWTVSHTLRNWMMCGHVRGRWSRFLSPFNRLVEVFCFVSLVWGFESNATRVNRRDRNGGGGSNHSAASLSACVTLCASETLMHLISGLVFWCFCMLLSHWTFIFFICRLEENTIHSKSTSRSLR